MQVYFDNAATTPMRDEVIAAMSKVMEDCFGNPSSTHAFGRTAKTHIETARKSIAALLNAKPQEIIFTSGGTESDNMLIRAAVTDLGVKTIITTAIEHHAILHTVEYLEDQGIHVEYLEVNKEGGIDYTQLERVLAERPEKKLISLMHINNEIGTILDLDRVGELAKKYDTLFHTDAVQGVGHYGFDLEKCPIDFLSSAAHKYHGPKGVGFSFIRQNSNLGPFILGGSQERGLRAGTESVHNIVGMAKALELSYAHLDKEKAYVLSLKKYAIKRLTEAFPEVYFNGNCNDENKATYTLLNVALPIKSEKAALLNFHLDLKGIACSKGSACQSGSTKGSHVLDKVVPEEFKQWPSIRFSFSKYNTLEEIDYLVDTLASFNAS